MLELDTAYMYNQIYVFMFTGTMSCPALSLLWVEWSPYVLRPPPLDKGGGDDREGGGGDGEGPKASNGEGDQSGTQNSPSGEGGDPNSQSGDPNSQNGDPNSQSGDPNSQSGDPNSQSGEPASQSGEPKPQGEGDGKGQTGSGPSGRPGRKRRNVEEPAKQGVSSIYTTILILCYRQSV